jgi:hypothetical protein
MRFARALARDVSHWPARARADAAELFTARWRPTAPALRLPRWLALAIALATALTVRVALAAAPRRSAPATTRAPGSGEQSARILLTAPAAPPACVSPWRGAG